MEVLVACHVVARLTPDPLFEIQSGLKGGEILQVEIVMRTQKRLDLTASVPAGAVHVQPDRVAPQRDAVDAPWRESLLGCRRVPVQPAPAREGSDPPEHVQAVMMRAPRRYPQTVTALRPAPPQPGMEREPRFIFEDNGLARTQGGASFLGSPGTVARLRRAPGHTGIRHASGESRDDATRSALAGP